MTNLEKLQAHHNQLMQKHRDIWSLTKDLSGLKLQNGINYRFLTQLSCDAYTEISQALYREMERTKAQLDAVEVKLAAIDELLSC